MQHPFSLEPTSSQSITLEPTVPQWDSLEAPPDADDSRGTVLLSTASLKDLHQARRKMQQYQREYWMDFAQQRGMSFTTEPGPSDREPDPPDDEDPPMRWDSVMMPEKRASNTAFTRRANDNLARMQGVPGPRAAPRMPQVSMPQMPHVPLPRIPVRRDDPPPNTPLILPEVPTRNVPQWDRANVPHRERLRAHATRYESHMLTYMDKRLGA